MIELFTSMSTHEYISLLIFVLSVLFFIFGALIVFSDKFYTYVNETIWKEDIKPEDDLMPGKAGYYYGRYVRGIESILLGSIGIAFFVYAYVKILL